MPLSITSTAFSDGSAIPRKYTRDGDDVSPALAWSEVPENTRSLALIVDDPDAPDPEAPRMRWVHWVLYNIPADCRGLAEAVTPDKLPAGTKQGINDWQSTGYGGPCPPIGRHRYFHKLYALDIVMDDLHRPDRSQLEAAMAGHILANAELVGTYQKAR